MTNPTLKLLLVEDQRELADAVVAGLTAESGAPWQVERCATLAAALRQVGEHGPGDAVLLSLTLPDSQGLDTYLRLREACADTPVVLLTGTDEEALAVEAIQRGAQEYLHKSDLEPQLVGRLVRHAIERAHSQQALQASEQRFQRLLQSTTDYVFSVTVKEGQPVSTRHGPGCLPVTGYTPEEFAADPWLWHRLIYDKDLPRVLAQVEQLMRGETPAPLEHRLIHKTGGVRWIRNTSVPQRDKQGRLVGYDGLIADVTERRHAERLLALENAITRELSQSGTWPQMLANILALLCADWPWHFSAYWSLDAHAGRLRLMDLWREPAAKLEPFAAISRTLSLVSGAGLPGRVWAARAPLWITDFAGETACPRFAYAREAGLHGACAFPIRWDSEILGVIELLSSRPLPSDARYLQACATMGSQIGQFLMRKRSEDELVAERNLLRTLIDHLPDYVYIKDPESRFLINNAAHLRVLGAAASHEVLGKTDFDFFPRDLAAQYRADELAVLQSGQPMINREEQVVDPQGNTHWVLATKVPLQDAQGKALGLVGISRDITERNHAAEQQRLSEARLQAILDNSPAVIYLKDTRGRYLLINRRFEELFHVRRDALVGKTDQELFSKEAADAFRANDRQVLQALRPLKFEEVAPHDDTPHTYISVKFPLLDMQGVPYGVCGISTDITERKQAEQAVKESQERLALVIQGSNDGIWDWNVTANEVYYSPRWKSMLGYEDHEIENQFSSWEQLLHPDDRERSLAAVQAYFSGQAPAFELEHRLRHKDGTYRWILARGVALRDPEGRPLRMAGSHVDLTDHKRKEDQLRLACAELAQKEDKLRHTLARLRASHEELKAAQLQLMQAEKLESVGKLAAGVAHEVKNPLQTILMGLSYLSNSGEVTDPNAALALAEMRGAIDRANAILRELLLLAATTQIELKSADLHGIIQQTLEQHRLELKTAGVEVDCQFTQPLPPLKLDPAKMEQVFVNLILNAMHAMPKGGALTIRTRAARWRTAVPAAGRTPHPIKTGDLVVVVELQDSGTGIPEAVLPKIFDPFFTTKPIGKGTGLGLAVIKNIIDLHGGIINIRNAAGGGVLVTLTLKAQQGTTIL